MKRGRFSEQQIIAVLRECGATRSRLFRAARFLHASLRFLGRSNLDLRL
jgi:hypothetical protein